MSLLFNKSHSCNERDDFSITSAPFECVGRDVLITCVQQVNGRGGSHITNDESKAEINISIMCYTITSMSVWH